MHALGPQHPACRPAQRRAIVSVLAHTVHCTVASELLNNDVDFVTVHTLLGYATMHTTAQHDRRGKRAKQQVRDRARVGATADRWCRRSDTCDALGTAAHRRSPQRHRPGVPTGDKPPVGAFF